jgi:hypothetical protein
MYRPSTPVSAAAAAPSLLGSSNGSSSGHWPYNKLSDTRSEAQWGSYGSSSSNLTAQELHHQRQQQRGLSWQQQQLRRNSADNLSTGNSQLPIAIRWQQQQQQQQQQQAGDSSTAPAQREQTEAATNPAGTGNPAGVQRRVQFAARDEAEGAIPASGDPVSGAFGSFVSRAGSSKASLCSAVSETLDVGGGDVVAGHQGKEGAEESEWEEELCAAAAADDDDDDDEVPQVNTWVGGQNALREPLLPAGHTE